MNSLPATEDEIDAFLGAFEDGTLPKARWTHAAHIFTGACVVHRLGEAAAIDPMRVAIQRYNQAVGGQNTESAGYHETVTLFWIKLLAWLRESQPALTRLAFATFAVARFAQDRELLGRFYDFDVVASTDARRRWVAPTLRSVDDLACLE